MEIGEGLLAATLLLPETGAIGLGLLPPDVATSAITVE